MKLCGYRPIRTCNTHRTYCSLAQPYKGTHACRRQVTTALFSQWLWMWAQVSQLWCRYGRRRQWSEGDVDEVYGLIEQMCPGGRKIEIFGRRHNIRPGWLTLGSLWTRFAREIYWKEYRLSEHLPSLSCYNKFDQVSREEDHCPFFTECNVVRCFDSKLYFSPRIDSMLSTCILLNNVTQSRQSGTIGDVARWETSFLRWRAATFVSNPRCIPPLPAIFRVPPAPWP